MWNVPQRYRALIRALLLANGVSLFLLFIRVSATKSGDYSFMLWNLLLAWIPVLISIWLVVELRHRSWREPRMILLSVAWLFFLPNSFYMMTDLIHLQQTGDIGLLFDVVLLLSFIMNGLVAGFLSVYLVHEALLKRRSADMARSVVVGTLLLVSFAIYLGRSLRWNSWDVLANPGGLLYDVSERVINPFSYPQALATTALFFLVLSSMYVVIRQFATLKHR